MGGSILEQIASQAQIISTLFPSDIKAFQWDVLFFIAPEQ